MLVLDEAVGACTLGFIKEERLLELIGSKPEKLEVILTGQKSFRELFCSRRLCNGNGHACPPLYEGNTRQKRN